LYRPIKSTIKNRKIYEEINRCLLFLIMTLLLLQTLFGSGADQKVIPIGNAGALTGDADAPCVEISNCAQVAVDGGMPSAGSRA
jgi:hypothetical protein